MGCPYEAFSLQGDSVFYQRGRLVPLSLYKMPDYAKGLQVTSISFKERTSEELLH